MQHELLLQLKKGDRMVTFLGGAWLDFGSSLLENEGMDLMQL